MKIELDIVYDDDDVTVFIAPTESEAEEIIAKMLKKKPMTLKEIYMVLSNLVSDEKIRKILRKMMEENKVEFNQDTKKYRWKK